MELNEPLKLLNESLIIVNSFLTQNYGFKPPSWVNEGIIFIFALATILILIVIYFKQLKDIFLSIVKKDTYKTEKLKTKAFLNRRNGFVSNFIIEVTRLNKESDWNDSIYTELDTEVEVGKRILKYPFHSRSIVTWINYFYFYLIYFFKIKSSGKIENSLSEAINNSKSHTFILIGDPGSGKTVSLRHLFLEIAKKCEKSRDEKAVVPVYLNLKGLTIPPEEINAVKIREWIIEELTSGQDRTINEFVNCNFNNMLEEGSFFFLFDSFDEIPAVMDAQEEHEIIEKYSLAIDRFLHANYLCKGLVSSRPFRSPNKFEGQKITILPFPPKRLKEAIDKNMGAEVLLAEQLWHDLIQRDDLLSIICNPFYLSLLTQYCVENKKLPGKHYDLFEHFIQKRLRTDEKELLHFGFTAEELTKFSEILAFSITNTPNVGLEVEIDQIYKITKNLKILNWNRERINLLINALSYSKLGKVINDKKNSQKSFSFVHRRFQEYFCASYLKKERNQVPFEYIGADNRWREVLVLLCEVLPIEDLSEIIETARLTIKVGNSDNIDSTEKLKVIETIRFLKDGFRSRLEEIPNDLKVLCSQFIQNQFKNGNLLDKKRAIEGLILVDDKDLHSILESAFMEDSEWLKEAALRSCRLLRYVPDSIGISIRKSFYIRYLMLKTNQDYYSYSVLFSHPQILKPFKQFLTILLNAMVIQILTYIGIYIYYFIFDIEKTYLIHQSVFITLFIFAFFNLMEYSYGSLSILALSANFFTSLLILFPSALIISTTSLIISTNNFAYVLLPVTFFIFLNLFLVSLVYIYPKNLLAWIIYPFTVLSKLLTLKKEDYLFFLKGILIIFVSFIIIIIISVAAVYSFIVTLNSGYSINRLYLSNNPIIASFIIIIDISTFLLILYTSLNSIHIMVNTLFSFILDQLKLKKLFNSLDKIPLSVEEAFLVLNSFKTEGAKIQYKHQLFEWLPKNTDSKIIVKEAENNKGKVKDILYELAEHIEDST